MLGEDEELRVHKVTPGAQHSRSRKHPGYESDLMRDADGNLLGTSASRPATDDDLPFQPDFTPPTPTFKQELANSAIDGIVQGFMNAMEPHFQRWVDVGVDKATKGISDTVQRAKVKRQLRQQSKAAAAVRAQAAEKAKPAETASDKAPAANDEMLVAKPFMTKEEYAARLRYALAAERYAAEQKQLLLGVQIADDDRTPELTAATIAVLEAAPAKTNEKSFIEVMQFLSETAVPKVQEPVTEEP